MTTMEIHELGTLLRDVVASTVKSVPDLLTADKAAERLGISVKVFRSEVRSKRIRFILIGRRRKFTEDDLNAYIEKQRGMIPCQSTSRKVHRTSTMTSNSKVYDIMARRGA